MQAKGFLFLTVNGGPVVSVPVSVETDKLVMELWYGDHDAANADPAVRAHIEGILTRLEDLRLKQVNQIPPLLLPEPGSDGASPPH
jgi:hypothetical protein